jgi:hypothetical protein
VFPKVALLQGPAASLPEAEVLLEAADVQAETSHRIGVSFVPLHLDAPMDLLVAITLPPSAGVRALRDGDGILATQLPAPARCFFASSTDADLAPMDVEYAIELVFEEEPPAKAGLLDPEREEARATTFLRVHSPSPTSGTTLMRFGLECEAPLALVVYDAGRQLRTLAHGKLAAGTHVRTWDGKDERGHDVAAGVYLVRLVAGGAALTGKLVMTR